MEQYAVYVLGGTIFAIGSVLATMSVPSAVIFFISRRDGRSTDGIIAESLRIIRVLGVIAVIIAGSVIWLYRREFGDWSGPLAALAAPAVFFAARCNLWRAVAYAEGRGGIGCALRAVGFCAQIAADSFRHGIAPRSGNRVCVASY